LGGTNGAARLCACPRDGEHLILRDGDIFIDVDPSTGSNGLAMGSQQILVGAALKGGLVSYGFDTVEQQRGAASYVDRVLKGEKPANLPVQVPTKYQLVIDLKTGKALGVNVPVHLQQIADEMVE
jgi:hypothetical protein